jgi:multiple sugar transport system substrate-binding protein
MYSWNGHTYGIPKDYDTIALFYNKALFDAKGAAYPTNNWTWDDLKRAAIALTDTSKGVYGIAMDATDTQAGLFPFVATNGGSVLSADGTVFKTNTPQTIETLKFLISFSNEDHSSPGFAETKELNAFERFLAAKAAMIVSGSYDAGDFYEGLGDSLGIARLPIKTQNGNCIHGLAFQINAYSKNKEAAWEFVKLFTSKEAGEIMGKLVIPAYSGADKVFIDAFPSLNIQLFVDAVQYAAPLSTPSVGSSAQSSALSTMLEKIWTGADVAQAAAELDAECLRIASEYKK